jgi:hypothetical protein
VQPEGEQVGIAESLGDLDGLAGSGSRRRVVAGRLMLDHDRQQEVAVLDAGGSVTVEQPLPPAEPASCSCRFPPQRLPPQEAETEPEGAPRGTQQLTVLDVCRVSTLEGEQVLLVTAEHEDGRRKQLEVGGTELARPIGERQRLVGVRPAPGCMEPAPAPEVLLHRLGRCHGANLAALDFRSGGRLPMLLSGRAPRL